ncbi:MAG: CRISPR-associated endonuclease Cas2 [Myxococcales bacterium]|nr:CRISPR-associated endonuclease Cas2 [Myxococcales bacterium]
MPRNRYLVSYDITEDKRRTRLAKSMEGYGDRVQYSVFLCDLNARELVQLRTAIHAIVHQRDDQALIVDLGPADGRADRRVTTIGRPLEPPVRARIV